MKQNPQRHSARVRTAARQRPGIAMLLVLAAVAGVFVIGMAMVNTVPATIQASSNMAIRDAANYLADSALAEALYRVENQTQGVAWMTATDRTIAGLNGTYSYVITDNQDSTYTITATGQFTTDGGTVITREQVLRVSFEQTGSAMTVNAAAILNGGSPIGIGMEFEGDVHFRGNAINLGEIDGDLRATGRVLIAGKVDGSVYSYADDVAMPSINLDAYHTYSHNGSVYQARVMTAEQLSDEGDDLEPQSPDNPLGIIVVDGDLKMDDDIEIEDGILVVRGSLDPDGHELKVEGPVGHMSLLVEDNVRFRKTRSQLKVESGMLYIGGNIFYLGGRKHRFEAEQGMILAGYSPLLFPGKFEVSNDELDNGSQQVRYFGEQRGGGGQLTVTGLQFVTD